MDALATLLYDTRARGAMFSTSLLDAPWAIRFDNRAPPTMLTMPRGRGWILAAGAEPVPLPQGAVAIVRGPATFTVADHPGTAPHLIVLSEELCTDPLGKPMMESTTLGPRTWGDRPDAEEILISASYQIPQDIGARLLAGLPPVAVVPPGPAPTSLTHLLRDEITVDRPGQQIYLDRLLDLVLVDALRAWYQGLGADAPAWYRALDDPLVGPALRLIHEDPAHAWTVAELAARVGVSRAGFARRFRDVVGEPPMAYLAGWRVQLAADLLRRTDDTVAAIARRVGYSDGYALSTAFHRLRDIRPGEFRRTAAADSG